MAWLLHVCRTLAFQMLAGYIYIEKLKGCMDHDDSLVAFEVKRENGEA